MSPMVDIDRDVLARDGAFFARIAEKLVAGPGAAAEGARAARSSGIWRSIDLSTMREAVADAVAELPDPHRSILAQHFAQRARTERIAATTGSSVDSIRARMESGLEAVRAKLDLEFGTRERWSRALALHAGIGVVEPRLAAPPAPRRTPLVAIVVVVALVAAAWMLGRASAPIAEPAPPVEADLERDAVTPRPVAQTPLLDAREVDALPAAPDPGAAPRVVDPLGAAKPIPPSDLVPPKTIEVRVHLLDPWGGNVVGASVSLARIPPFEVFASKIATEARTGDDGIARFASWPTGQPFEVTCWPAPYTARPRKVYLPVGPHEHTVRIRSFESGTIRGRVLTEEGSGLDWGKLGLGTEIRGVVRMTPLEAGIGWKPAEADVERDGSFSFQTLETGRWKLRASVEGFADVEQEVAVSSGERRLEDLRLPVAPTLRGTIDLPVLTWLGSLQDDLSVFVPSREAQGAWSFTRSTRARFVEDRRRGQTRFVLPLPDSIFEYPVFVAWNALGQTAGPFYVGSFRAPRSGVLLAVPPTADLHVAPFDPSSAEPVRDLEVTARPYREPFPSSKPRVATPSSGSSDDWVLKGLTPGDWMVRIEPKTPLLSSRLERTLERLRTGVRPTPRFGTIVERVTITGGAPQDLRVPLAAPRTLRARFADQDGWPVAWLPVQLVETDGRGREEPVGSSALTDGDGWLLWEGATVRGRIVVVAEGFMPYERSWHLDRDDGESGPIHHLTRVE